MTRLAFYAPMKSPDHPVPSGDRTIARHLRAAFAEAGFQTELASRLSTRDGTGSAAVQASIRDAAEDEVERCVAAGRTAGWAAWITYHNYYKAPDLIGPAVARELDIPYLQIESTRARKRLQGPWASFAKAAEAATDRAAVVWYFTTRDAETLHLHAPPEQRLLHLRPFLNRSALSETQGQGTTILSVGMMRAGDKLASFGVIAETLSHLADLPWQLRIVGEGPASAEVARLMADFGDRITLLGRLEGDELARAYGSAGIFLWPGVNEAIGLVFLEAQAAGLAVVAQNRPGMNEVLAPCPAGAFPDPEAGPPALAALLRRYLTDDGLRHRAAEAGRDHIATHHLLPAAARSLAEGLAALGVTP